MDIYLWEISLENYITIHTLIDSLVTNKLSGILSRFETKAVVTKIFSQNFGYEILFNQDRWKKIKNLYISVIFCQITHRHFMFF